MTRLFTRGIRFLLENSAFLMAGAITALAWAWWDHESYHHVIETTIGGHTLHWWVNDVLMSMFFALAGKEIFESFLPGGQLHSVRKAATPLLATIGGMAMPALLYTGGCYLTSETALLRGWAIPTATDIAFSYLAAKLIFGPTHPAIPFLLLIAVADDAGGLIILATCYAQGEIHLGYLFGLSGLAVAAGLVLNKVMRVRSFWPYLIIAGTISWFGFYLGGIHPALALIPIVCTMPHGKRDVGVFAETNHADTLNDLEHWWEKPVELILGIFALVNAGVQFSSVGTPTALVLVGLVVGKPLGITLFACLGVLIGLKLPDGLNKKDLVVLGSVGGIGFTVALFVSGVAFPTGATLDAAKMGALFSLISLIVAFALAKVLGVKKKREVIPTVLSAVRIH